jgi:hypothetical protein
MSRSGNSSASMTTLSPIWSSAWPTFSPIGSRNFSVAPNARV